MIWFSFPIRLDLRTVGAGTTSVVSVGIANGDCRGLYEAGGDELVLDRRFFDGIDDVWIVVSKFGGRSEAEHF